MNETLIKLEQAGCDIKSALARSMDDEDFLLYCINTAAVDPAFAELGAALESADVEQAFEKAHTLKGVCGTVGFSPVYTILVSMVETLRCGSLAGMRDEYRTLIETRDHLVSLLPTH